MTLPGGVSDVTIPDRLPALLWPMGGPGKFKRGISSGYDLTQANVERELKRDKVINNRRIRGAKGDVDNWTNDIAEAWATAAQSVWHLTQQLPIIGDFIEVFTGKEDGNTNDLGTAINTWRQELQDNRNRLVNGLFGWDRWDATGELADQAVRENAETVAALGAAVADLQNDRNNSSVGGKGVVVDFTTRPTASTLGADFDQSYTGSGTGTLGIVNGTGAHWNAKNDASRTCLFRYNALQTATDYQKVWVAFGSSPEQFGRNAGRNEIHGRKNAAGTAYVYAAMEKGRAELGCYVGGAKTMFVAKTSGFSFKSTGLYALECGTVGVLGLRVFRLLDSNGSVILAHTEVGTTSQAGPDYRGGGGAVYAVATGFGTTGPGDMLAWAMADNYPPTLVGSIAKMYRANTGLVAINSGINPLPTDFFDNSGATTADYIVSRPNGSFTVTMDGNYWCKIQAKTVDLPEQFTFVLFINDNPYEHAGDAHCRGVNILGGNVDPKACSAEITVPLQSGDTVSWGTDSVGFSGTAFGGEASGSETFCKMALDNRSLA
ncbi:MAG: hypothetical protein AB1925_12465 [Actinomycetota bacterium]